MHFVGVIVGTHSQKLVLDFSIIQGKVAFKDFDLVRSY